jgi:hypothetical protein
MVYYILCALVIVTENDSLALVMVVRGERTKIVWNFIICEGFCGIIF